VNSIKLRLWNEAAVCDEVGRQQRHAALTCKLDEACINMLVWEPLHQLVVTDSVSCDMDRVGDPWRCQTCFFNACDGFHRQIVSQRYGQRNTL
jgi:hypothetical protein